MANLQGNIVVNIPEEDLGQKSTLGMTDYVRIVGSDGVSYKQGLDDVSGKIITEHNDTQLGGVAQSVKQAIDTLDNSVGSLQSDNVQTQIRIDSLQAAVGTPLVASTVASMTDHDKIYVYVGSESGYTSGHWYYWNGSAWADGGVYNSTAFETDKTLTLSDRAADAKATGDAIDDVKSALSILTKKAYSVTNYQRLTRDHGSANVLGNNVVVTSNNSYNTYHMEVPEDTEIYFDAIPTNNYISLCVLNGYTSTTTGETQITYNGSGAVRYRSSESNLPTINNKLSVKQGDYIFITCSITETTYKWIYGAEWSRYDYSDKLSNDLPKRCKVIYDNVVSGKETERLYVYLPAKNGYTRVNFCHAIDESMNYDIWLIHPLYAVNDDLVSQYQITTSGEFECALHINSESDFMGGTSHGDEIYYNILFLLDNEVVEPNDITELAEFNELKVIVNSYLYDADNHTTLRVYHSKEYVFNDSGITINQTAKWATSAYVVDSYLAMFPVKKDISPKIVTDNEYQVRTFATDGYFSEMNTTKAISFSDDFNATFEITNYDIVGTDLQNVGKFLVTDNNGGAYNKQYFICTTAGHVSAGDTWRSTTKYAFDV